MSAQDKTEQVLREMHIMYANSEVYDKATNRVIIDKKEALNLLQRLNVCIYELMEEHELTQQSRDAAERQFRRRTESSRMRTAWRRMCMPDRSCIRMRRFTAYRISCRMRWTLSGRSAIR